MDHTGWNLHSGLPLRGMSMAADDIAMTLGVFPSTHWSAVVEATGDAANESGREALGRLLSRYVPAMRAFLLLDRQIDRHRCDDLIQGFIAEMVLGKNLLRHADRERGRFRTFILACLNRYVGMQHRHDSAAMRHPQHGQIVALDPHVLDLPDRTRAVSDAFDVAWARQVLDEALQRMKRECDASLRPDLWALFEGRVIAPALEGAPPLPYAELTERFGFATPAQATNALVTAKRMFQRIVHAVVSEYAEEGDADDELAQLKLFLSRAR